MFASTTPTLTRCGRRWIWSKYYMESCHGTVDIYVDGEVLCAEADLETALLEALVWQMEKL